MTVLHSNLSIADLTKIKCPINGRVYSLSNIVHVPRVTNLSISKYPEIIPRYLMPLLMTEMMLLLQLKIIGGMDMAADMRELLSQVLAP
jgi:hypothetical protein